MKKYIINAIYADGYERFATIEETGHDTKLTVHFLEYDEYIENGGTSEKRKKGDILKGNLSIELVGFSEKVDKGLIYYQKIQESSHIEAVIKVAQIIDEYSLYAVSSISDDNILIEFESAAEYNAGDNVLVIGSLELSVVAANSLEK